MAKIVYFKSPIDESKVVEISSKGTLRYAMRELGIENNPVCVSINGMTPEELDLETILDDTDVVEIRHLVNGGGNADNKSNLATIIQIAGLVALTYLTAGGASPWLVAAVAVGGTVAAGALNKWAMDLRAAQGTNDNEVNVNANSYSLATSSNEVRGLKPIPVVIGSHRMAPDVHTDSHRRQYGGLYGIALSTLSQNFNAGYLSSNGPEAANNSWAVMPANYLATGLPQYPIKIAPYGIISKTTALTPEENQFVIDVVKNGWNGLSSRSMYNFMEYAPSPVRKRMSFPVIIYHHHPSDIYRGRFNTMWSLQRIKEYYPSDPTSYNLVANLFLGILDGAMNFNFFSGINTNNAQYTLFNGNPFIAGGTTYLPSTMVWGTAANMMTAYSNVLLALNGGSYTTTPKVTSPSHQMYYLDTSETQTKPGIPYATQLFNYGFGDLDISDRKVGSSNINVSSASTVGISEIDKSNPTESFRWRVPNVSAPDIGLIDFPFQVFAMPSKTLINPSFDIGVVSAIDNNSYNWIFFTGKKGMDAFRFAVSGRLYRTTSSSIAINSTRFQIQWKRSRNPVWNEFVQPVNTLNNANTQNMYIYYNLNLSNMGNPSPEDLEDSLDVRIRKINLDSTDNESGRVSELSIVDAYFHPTNSANEHNNDFFKNVPMNIEGLYTTALITDSATTNRFSALVESKCWVYDFENQIWSWSKTRNPAFWFLFYARGGFLNYESMADLAPPYSPTYGWQNYPGHPNNTDQIFGGGYTDEEIDIEKIKEWAFFCEENDLFIDMVLKEEESVAESLEKIANVGRASVSYYTGKLSVVVEDPDQVPVCLFGMGNIIAGSFSVDYSVGDPIKEVVGTYVNRETWDSEEVSAIVPFSESETIKKISLTLTGITEPELAQREVNLLAARQFFQKRVYRWQTDIEGYLARRGDLVAMAHDSTQYGYSGRAMYFSVESGVVKGIKTGSILGDILTHVMIREPNGEMTVYDCHKDGDLIVFDEDYPIEKAPSIVNVDEENPLSYFPNSIPEDFTFIADIKDTPGKRVRISQIEASEDGVFSITAVDEDPSMWAYEYSEGPFDPKSFDDSIYTVEVNNVSQLDLGAGRIKLMWNMTDGDFVQVINKNTNLPVEANGQYSFGEGEVVLELISGVKYDLEVRPILFGTPYYYKSKEITVWPL